MAERPYIQISQLYEVRVRSAHRTTIYTMLFDTHDEAMEWIGEQGFSDPDIADATTDPFAGLDSDKLVRELRRRGHSVAVSRVEGYTPEDAGTDAEDELRLLERYVVDEITGLRAAQVEAVMSLIGGLLDQWELLPNDVKGTIREDAEGLADYLARINEAMETAGNTET